MQKRKHLMAGNWKMNPASIEEAKKVIAMSKKTAKLLKRTELVVCPPYPFLSLSKFDSREKLQLGVQDVFVQPVGSFTGEVSSEMVRGLGAKFAIIGHSERRAMGESDDFVAKKTTAALMAGLKVIVCVGERSRDQSGAYLEFLRTQLTASLSGVKKKFISEVIVAYEPVFAIGKSFAEAMQPRDIEETVLFLKKVLSDIFGKDWKEVRVLYGGSVNFENAASIIKEGSVDGLLIGRESLNLETFPKLLAEVDAVSV